MFDRFLALRLRGVDQSQQLVYLETLRNLGQQLFQLRRRLRILPCPVLGYCRLKLSIQVLVLMIRSVTERNTEQQEARNCKPEPRPVAQLHLHLRAFSYCWVLASSCYVWLFLTEKPRRHMFFGLHLYEKCSSRAIKTPVTEKHPGTAQVGASRGVFILA